MFYNGISCTNYPLNPQSAQSPKDGHKKINEKENYHIGRMKKNILFFVIKGLISLQVVL